MRTRDLTIIPERLNSAMSTVSAQNNNLSEPQKELMRWHARLGHMGVSRVQSLMRSGILAFRGSTRTLHAAVAKLTDIPKCAACLFGKQTRRPAQK